jgi:hypothetical protein
VVCSYHEILLKEGNYLKKKRRKSCNKINEAKRHYDKLNKPVAEDLIL